MKNKIILIIGFFMSFSVQKDIKAQQISDNSYSQTKINCTYEDEVVLSCKCLKKLSVSFDYDSNPSHIIFSLYGKKWVYDMDNFSGISSNVYMYKKDTNVILFVELLYEYSSNVLVFYLYNDGLYFLKELVFEVPSDLEGGWSYEVKDNKKGILVRIKYAKHSEKIKLSKGIKYNTIDFSLKKKLNVR